MQLSAEQLKVADSLTWNFPEVEPCFSAGNGCGFDRFFPAHDPGSIDIAAYVVPRLSLRVRLPFFRDDSSVDISNVLYTVTVGCQFRDFDEEDLLDLDPLPDRVIVLADLAYALWPTLAPLSGREMADLQRELRDGLGGDPSWSAEPGELFPVAGVIYEIDGTEEEAVELEVPQP